MRRQEIIFELKKYFQIYELVGKWTYRIHKDRAWKFFSTESLEMLLIIRKNIDRPMTINTWFWGGKFSQRGLRSNLSTIFKRMFSLGKLYLSAHVLGEGFDFDVEPKGKMLLLRNSDIPGFIGHIGQILGDNNINISDFRLARGKDSALAVILVDEPIKSDILEKIKTLEAAISVAYAEI